MVEKQFLTTQETAAYLGISARSLQGNWHRWKLYPTRIGKRNMWRKTDIDKYVKDHIITEPMRVS
jgi:Helix-turn-helix domain